MRCFVDLTIFSSPTRALGNATGVVLVSDVPVIGAPFPWPPVHGEAGEKLGKTLEEALVMNISVSIVDAADLAIDLDGCVFRSASEAMEFAELLFQSYGLEFSEY